MADDDTLFRCLLERTGEEGRERKVVEVWAGWPGKARGMVKREGWRVVAVEADFLANGPGERSRSSA